MPRVAVIITPIATLLPGQKMNELLKTLGLARRASFFYNDPPTSTATSKTDNVSPDAVQLHSVGQLSG